MKIVQNERISTVSFSGYSLIWDQLIAQPVFVTKAFADEVIEQRTKKIEDGFLRKINDEERVNLEQAGIIGVPFGVCEGDYNSPNSNHHILVGDFVQLSIAVNTQCNLSCPHCILRKVEDASDYNSSVPFSKETVVTAINNFVKYTGRDNFALSFVGAEPLLSWDVIDFVLYTYRDKIKNNQIDLGIVSNLSIVTDEILLGFRKFPFYITTSLDGPVAVNDSIRRRRYDNGLGSAVVTNIKKIQSQGGSKVGSLNIMLHKKNYKTIDRDFLYWIMNDLRISSFYLTLDNLSVPQFSNMEIIEKYMALYSAAKDLGMEMRSELFVPFENLMKKKNFAYCGYMEGKGLSVLGNGDIFTCSLSRKRFGTKFDFLSIDMNELESFISQNSKGARAQCKGCAIEGACCGGCYLVREYSENTGKNRNELANCELTKAITCLLAQDYLQDKISCLHE